MDWSAATPKQRHRPRHLVGAGEALFITTSTVSRVRHFASAERKDRLVAALHSYCAEHEIDLLAWVVLEEHYHVVVCPEQPDTVPTWLQRLHRGTARAVNREDRVTGRQVWYQFWDTTLWTEGDLWSRINYVHANPVRHGYVETAVDWKWSSLRELEPYLCEPEPAALRQRFPAPRKLPNDEF